MRFQGRIKSWNEAGGFGFIRWNGGSDEVYVHITAFAEKGRRPQAGDIVSYSVGRDANGRHRAEQVAFAGQPEAVRGKSGLPWFAMLAVTLGIGICVVLFLRLKPSPPQALPAFSEPRSLPQKLEPADEPLFRCEGKTRCPEMRSCEEAKFYLRNCPGSLSDGDGDGIPCEDQWCGH